MRIAYVHCRVPVNGRLGRAEFEHRYGQLSHYLCLYYGSAWFHLYGDDTCVMSVQIPSHYGQDLPCPRTRSDRKYQENTVMRKKYTAKESAHRNDKS